MVSSHALPALFPKPFHIIRLLALLLLLTQAFLFLLMLLVRRFFLSLFAFGAKPPYRLAGLDRLLLLVYGCLLCLLLLVGHRRLRLSQLGRPVFSFAMALRLLSLGSLQIGESLRLLVEAFLAVALRLLVELFLTPSRLRGAATFGSRHRLLLTLRRRLLCLLLLSSLAALDFGSGSLHLLL